MGLSLLFLRHLPRAGHSHRQGAGLDSPAVVQNFKATLNYNNAHGCQRKSISIPGKSFLQSQQLFSRPGGPFLKTKPRCLQRQCWATSVKAIPCSPHSAWLYLRGSAGHGSGVCSACALSVPQSGLQISVREEQKFIICVVFYDTCIKWKYTFKVQWDLEEKSYAVSNSSRYSYYT